MNSIQNLNLELFGKITLILLFGFVLIYVLIFVNLDKTPPHWDYAGNLLNSLDYVDIFERKDWVQLVVYSRFYYPPLLFILMGIFIKLLGYAETTVVLLNFTFLLVLLITVFRFIKSQLDELTAITSAALIIALVVNGITMRTKLWELMLDFPLMVVTMVSYCVFFSETLRGNFTFGRGFRLGILCSVALLIKWTALVLLLIPVVFYCFEAFRHRRAGTVFGLFVAIGILAGTWYAFQAHWLFPKLWFYAINFGSLRGDPQGLSGFGFYLNKFMEFSNWIIFLLLPLIWGFISAGFKKDKHGLHFRVNTDRKERLSLWINGLNIIFPLIILSFVFTNKDYRYLFSSFVFIYFVAHWYLIKLMPVAKRRLVNTAVITIAIIRAVSYLPLPNTSEFPIDKAFKSLDRYQPKRVAYFFEDNSDYFNFNNLMLRYRELAHFKGEQRNYFFLNTYAGGDKIHSCMFKEKPEMIIVYSDIQHASTNPSEHVTYETTCPKDLTINYRLVNQEVSSLGTLTFYQEL